MASRRDTRKTFIIGNGKSLWTPETRRVTLTLKSFSFEGDLLSFFFAREFKTSGANEFNYPAQFITVEPDAVSAANIYDYA